MTGNASDPADERPLERPPGFPRWVSWLGAGAVAVVVVLVVVMLLVGGEHGPGMHGG